MKITQALLGEHGALKAQFDHLDDALREAGSLAEVQGLGGVLEAALATHAAIEDEVLFAALVPITGPEGPLAVMREEHEEIESSLRKASGAEDAVRARDLVRHALQVAREHFDKEEAVLFPMADRALGEDALERLGREWAARRNVRVS